MRVCFEPILRNYKYPFVPKGEEKVRTYIFISIAIADTSTGWNL